MRHLGCESHDACVIRSVPAYTPARAKPWPEGVTRSAEVFRFTADEASAEAFSTEYSNRLPQKAFYDFVLPGIEILAIPACILLPDLHGGVGPGELEQQLRYAERDVG